MLWFVSEAQPPSRPFDIPVIDNVLDKALITDKDWILTIVKDNHIEQYFSVNKITSDLRIVVYHNGVESLRLSLAAPICPGETEDEVVSMKV